MMHWIGGGMGVGMWFGMGVFWLLLVALIVWLVVRLATYGHDERRTVYPGAQPWRGPSVPPAGGPVPPGSVPFVPVESPFEILDRRLAAGEIDLATYQRLRAALVESRGGQA